MEERKALVRNYVAEGLTVRKALEIVDMPSSTYYSSRTYKSKGRIKTAKTMMKGTSVADDVVVKRINQILAEPYIDYGYKKITICLQRDGYKIGRKKVYRLMKENKLLQKRLKQPTRFDKNIIKSKPRPTRPLEILELDIKYVFIDGIDRNAYLMTIIDTFTRQVYEWSLELTMKTTDVKNLIEKFIDKHLINGNDKIENMSVSFRTDNGTQFTSKMYKKIMETFEFTSTYIPPATPQLNGHIESYHSTVEREVCEPNKFTSLEHAKKEFEKFVTTYNTKRNLTVLLELPPVLFKYAWNQELIIQKQKNKNLIFFFKEEDKEKQHEIYNQLVNEYKTNAA